MRKLRILLPLLLGSTIIAVLLSGLRQRAVAQAAPSTSIYFVDVDAAGATTGLSWTDAFTNVQDALSVAANGSEIWVAAGIYYPDRGAGQVEDAVTSTFSLVPGVAIYGGFASGEAARTERDWAANVTVLSGDIDGNDTTNGSGVVEDVADISGANAYHVVSGAGVTETAILDGFFVTAGKAIGTLPDDQGGGMYNDGSSPTIANATFIGNLAELSTGRGGAVFNNNGSSPFFENVLITANAARLSGGMLNDNGSSPVLLNVSFIQNTGSFDGAGLYNRMGSSPVLTNVLFYRNTSGGEGGAIHNRFGSNPTLMNVTITENSADRGGGGFYNYDNSNPIVVNTIIWNNGGGEISNVGSVPVFSYSDIRNSGGSDNWQGGIGTDGGNNIDSDPRFVDQLGGDLQLLPDSPVVDAGTTNGCPGLDLAGNPRPAGTSCDMGAYELQPSIAFIKTVDDLIPEIGQTITFTIRLHNTGVGISDGVITDSLPGGLNFLGPIALEPDSAGTVGTAPPLLATNLTLASSDVVTVTFPVTVSDEVMVGWVGSVVTNTAFFASGDFSEPINASVSMTITGNYPPMAADDPGAGFEAYFTTIPDAAFNTSSVLINDSDLIGGPLVVKSFDAGSTIGLVTHLGYGVFHYDPNGQFGSLTAGQQVTDTFSYVVSDGIGGTDTATVTITIVAGNSSPIASDDSGSEFTTLNSISFWTTSVLVNDTDPDGDVLQVLSVDLDGTVGEVTHLGYGVFGYDPNGQFDTLGPGEQATDSFAYTLGDGHGGVDTATVTITIVGEPPCGCLYLPLTTQQ